MIVLHRRGTTGEWQQADLVAEQISEVLLKDGEFAIEEREDGSRWIKVGDGRSVFSKLPYIDDRAVALLSDKLAVVKTDLEKKLIELDNSNKRSVTATRQALTQQINDQVEALTTAFKVQDDLLLEKAEQMLDFEAGAIRNELSEVSDTSTKAINAIKPTIAALDKKLDSKVTELSALNKQNTAAISALADTVETNAAAIDSKLDTYAAEVADKLENRATELNNYFANNIAATKSSLESLVVNTAKKQANDLQSVVTSLERQLTDSDKAHTENITKLTVELESNNSQLSDSLAQHAKQNENEFISFLAQLTELKEEIRQLKTSDVSLSSLIYKVDNTLTAITTKISSDLSVLTASHELDCSTIVSNLNRQNEARIQADSDIIAVMLEYITDIYAELADLVDDDILILEKAYSVENTLTAKVNKVEKSVFDAVEAAAELNDSIEELRTNTDLKLISNQKALDSLATTVQTTKTVLENQLAIISAEVATNKANTSAAITDVNTRIESVNSRIDITNTELEAQSKRISNLISFTPGSTTGDAELADIRVGYNGLTHASAGDAVRAVGNDVTELRNSLSQYIDTQAIDGLRYDYSGEVGLMQPYMLYLTADGEVLEGSGVQIISGSGGSGSSTASSLKLGYITTSPIVTTTNDTTKLKFTFSGTDSSGDIILQAAATWKVNGTTVEYGNVQDGENEFDVTKYLTAGTTKILLIVTDDNGSVVTKSWSIQQIELSVDSAFDDKSTYPTGEDLIFSYTPYGSVEKTAIFKLDGKEIDRVTLTADVSGTEVKYRIPPQEHGSHLLEFYLEAKINGDTVTSNHKIKDLLFYDPTSEVPVIGTPAPTLETKQYSPVNIIYTVYDPKAETPTVTIKVDDIEVSTATLNANASYNNTPTGVYSYTESEVGTHTIKIVCRGEVKVVTVKVEKLGINVSPITTGLVFDFNPAGKSNGDVDNRLWSHGDIHMAVSSNFDWTNGGYIPDDPDGPCFCIKAGSTATIDYKLFADDAKKYGKELKLVFKTKNVANPEATFLSCLDNTTDRDHIGIEMGVHNTRIYGQSGSLELAYSEEDIIEFEFNISKNTEKVPMVMGYEDGVPSRPMVYDDTYNFKQSTPKTITIGSPDCDTYIYRFKVYNTSLTASDILNNFIADARTADEMISRYNRNQIYDENHKLTPETLAEKCPWLRVYKVSAPHFTNNKSDKVAGTTIQQLYKNGDPILDNWICYNAQHSGQGTSSNNYGAAGRNLDFIMNKSSSYFELGDGTTADKITLTRESVPVAYLNAKVNIASSNNLTNAILASRYNTFNPYRRPFVERDGINTDFIKDTMEFHNCVIFIQETDPDVSTHREFADNDWHFYAIGNIGDSKKTDSTRTTDPDDKYECCVEIMDVGLPLSDFPVDTMINAMSYTVDEKTDEKIYTWAKPENLDILYELVSGEYVKTEDTEIDLTKTYYVDILVHDDFSEDYTYGWRYISDDEDAEVVDFCKQKWIDFYRFVTTASDDEFKSRLSEYFVVDSALYYYLFTTRYCMVDNRAKNTFWHYGKTADGTRKWDLCWDYDNDTSLGLNNYGKQVYRYGLEDIDKDATGEEVFRESDSTFFCRVRDLFSYELKKMYNDLESKNAWHAESFINACDNWQNEFPEELWRIDIDRKYLRTFTSSFIGGKGDSQFLVNMCNGRMKYHRRQWERSQEQYMASKYQTITASGDNYHANFRFGKPNSANPSVPANYQLTLTPFSYIYLNVHYGGTVCSTVRAEPNVPTVVPFAGKDADIVNVYSASAIKDFGDLSACYPKTVSIGNATRVRKLTIGNDAEDYDNTAFTTLSTGSNPLLEEINVENISSLSQALNLTALTNLKKLFAFGTNIPSVIFAKGSKVNQVELPAVNNITLGQLKYLATNNFTLSSYNNVVDIVIEDCPLINQVELFNKCNNLRRARLIGVDFGSVTYEYFQAKVFGLKGLTAAGEETPNAVLKGSVRFDRLTGSQLDELNARYPELDISYDLLESTITFKDTDLETVVHQGISNNAADYEDPVCYDELDDPSDLPEGKIFKPTKESIAEFDYNFIGWSTSTNIIILSENLTDDLIKKYRVDSIAKVEGDRTLYPVFEAARRSYPVTFINPTITAGSNVLEVVYTLYGQNAQYSGAEPKKQDAASSDIYEFTGWFPKPEVIQGPLECEAQFVAKDENRKPTGEDDSDTLPGYTIGWLDLTDCVDPNGNVFDGYVLGYDKTEGRDTISITDCNNKYNVAIRIPEYLVLNDTNYYVISLGGFSEHTLMELIDIPSTVKEIQTRGFYNCRSLFELELPEYLKTIGKYAFQGCTRLKKVHIPALVESIGEAAFADCSNIAEFTVDTNNHRYITYKNCLIDVENGMLLQGLSNGEIPQDGSINSLGQYCFSNTKISSVLIPEEIETVPNNAFSRCYLLEELLLPTNLKVLDATCFAWCSKLKNVVLPNKLLQIKTYAFHGCAIEDIVIPASVNELLDNSFGNIANLTTVTFEKRVDSAGNIIAPYIHKNAFSKSGGNNGIVFNVPWSKDYDYNYVENSIKIDPTGWGATNYIINYDYKEA